MSGIKFWKGDENRRPVYKKTVWLLCEMKTFNMSNGWGTVSKNLSFYIDLSLVINAPQKNSAQTVFYKQILSFIAFSQFYAIYRNYELFSKSAVRITNSDLDPVGQR
jgi:hypothetical protein